MGEQVRHPALERPADEDIERAAVRGAAWVGVQTWGYNLIAFGIFVTLGRLLTPEDFGVVAAAYVVILFFRALVDAGFGRLVVQRSELTPDFVDTAFWTAIGIGLTFTLLTIIAAPLFSLLFSEPQLTGVIRALSPIFIFAALDSTQSSLLERRMEFRTQALRVVTAGVASAAVAIALALLGAGVWSLVAQQLVLEGVMVVLLWTLVSWRPSMRFSRSSFKELLDFGGRVTGIRILTYLNTNVDNVLVGVVLGPVALGYYTVAYRVLVVLNALLVVTINRVALTTFSKFQDAPKMLNAAFYRATSTAATICIPIYTGVALLGGPLLVLVFGEQWAKSGPVLQALALAGAVLAQTTFNTNYAMALGRVHSELRFTTVLVVVQIAAFAVAVNFGIVAVAASLGIVTALALPIRLVRIRSWAGLRLRTYFSRYPRIFLASIGMAGVVELAGSLTGTAEGGVALATQIAAGALAYIATFRVVAPRETMELWNTVKRLRD